MDGSRVKSAGLYYVREDANGDLVFSKVPYEGPDGNHKVEVFYASLGRGLFPKDDPEQRGPRLPDPFNPRGRELG